MGLTGAMCIHPNQVGVLNECFGASAAEIEEAKAIVAAWEARTDGVVSHNGKMIDQPVVERARRLLASAGQ
jgi:citrate lyase subunit beta/citryl-CoA lyase